MKLKTLLFISYRLTCSSRNKGIAHIISIVSLIGVAIGSFALVVVLSVFNGFTSVAQQMLEKNCPPLLIEKRSGKIIELQEVIPVIDPLPCSYSAVVMQNAMVNAINHKMIATVYGIDSTYFCFNALDSFIVSGRNTFRFSDPMFCIMGVNSAADLGLGKGAEKMNIPLKITVPSTDNTKQALVLEDKLSSIEVLYRGAFQSHSDSDEGVVFIRINQARELLGLGANQCHYVYVYPNKSSDVPSLKADMQKLLGSGYDVKTILEQEPVYFRIVKSEKLAVYIILAFIIFIACINIISAIIILKIQKEQMNKIFLAMGMRLKDLKKVYFAYGFFVNLFGCILGIISGIIVCLAQQRFSIVKLAKDSFVVEAFPVNIMPVDIICIFVLVLLIGSLCIRYGVSRLRS